MYLLPLYSDFISRMYFDTRKNLLDAFDSVTAQFVKARNNLQMTKEQLKQVNEQIHFAGQYYPNKSVQTAFLRSGNKGRFRSAHREELSKYDEAVKYFRVHHGGKITSLKNLKARRDDLIRQRDTQSRNVQELREQEKELRTVCRNVDTILGSDPSITKWDPIRNTIRKKTRNEMEIS